MLSLASSAAGLSQQQLADSVGIAKSYISSLELGYRAPHLNLLVKIAQALGLRPGELVDAMVEEADRTISSRICVNTEGTGRTCHAGPSGGGL